jgi:hypothetical protein
LFASVVFEFQDVGLDGYFLRRVIRKLEALCFECETTINNTDPTFNSLLIAASKEGQSELLWLITNKGNCIRLIFHIDVDGSNLTLNETIVLSLLLSEVRQITFKLGDGVIDKSGTSIDCRDSTFAPVSSRVEIKHEFGRGKKGEIGEIRVE